ncbi:MAG: DUF5606 domain-containing protein [Bacteroidales bacterium]|nr:DUF5606 domain-containing protein [Bacteroidales bacterium]
MDLSKILTISGKSGLFKVLNAQSKSGFVVESLNDGKKIPVFATHKVSALEDISVFTYTEDILLKKVFQNIFEKENGGKAIDSKSSDLELRTYFKSVLPDFDEERVYTSDIKKIISWYNKLVELSLLNFDEVEEEANTGDGTAEANEGKEEKPKKKATPKTEKVTVSGNKPKKTTKKTDKSE